MNELSWSEWRSFPDPEHGGYLIAPTGPGCYELRHNGKLILCGIGRSVAYRMSSLLPEPWGIGTRKNLEKRNYVGKHLREIEYRTRSFPNVAEAKAHEQVMLRPGVYLFNS
jgi:hypothetical protein